MSSLLPVAAGLVERERDGSTPRLASVCSLNRFSDSHDSVSDALQTNPKCLDLLSNVVLVAVVPL